jgi:outer membrane protein TolC
MATLALSIPIWDGGITKARVAEANADLSKAADTLTQVKLGVSLEVRTAALNVQDSLDRVSTTAENVSLAVEALRLANVRYNAGISTLVEVLDAESALTQARFNNVNALYDYTTAVADLERATATQPEMAKLQLLKENG